MEFTLQPIRNGLRIWTTKDFFRILQITDLHLAERYFLKVSQLRRLRKLIDRVRPDLIINTGDFFCRRRLLSPKLIVRLFTRLIGKDYPWTFAWGNHDCEAIRRGLWISNDDWEEEFHRFETFLSRTKNCLYVPSKDFIQNFGDLSPEEAEQETRTLMLPRHRDSGQEYFDGFYGGNFKLELIQTGRNEKAWDLFVLNSREYLHIPPQALRWMEEAINMDPRPVPAVCFYHIPNQAFQLLWESGRAKGRKGEAIHYQTDTGRIHQAFKRAGTIRACFAGHDHRNDFIGTYEGITYVYGRKTLRFSYGAVDSGQVPRTNEKETNQLEWGVKLITLGLAEEDPHRNTMAVATILESGVKEIFSVPGSIREPAELERQGIQLQIGQGSIL